MSVQNQAAQHTGKVFQSLQSNFKFQNSNHCWATSFMQITFYWQKFCLKFSCRSHFARLTVFNFFLFWLRKSFPFFTSFHLFKICKLQFINSFASFFPFWFSSDIFFSFSCYGCWTAWKKNKCFFLPKHWTPALNCANKPMFDHSREIHLFLPYLSLFINPFCKASLPPRPPPSLSWEYRWKSTDNSCKISLNSFRYRVNEEKVGLTSLSWTRRST